MLENEADINVTKSNCIFHNTEHSVKARHDFYQTEALRSGMNLFQLVDKVYRIYNDDIDTLDYSFEKYN